MTRLAIPLYVGALLIANLLVAHFGPAISPVLAFVFIGFDLALRDWLQLRMSPAGMVFIIAVAAGLTYALNPAADRIAVASSVSFAIAALVDWSVFTNLHGRWLKRSIGSNVAGAAVDSLLFPAIAFGAFLPHIVLMQFVAKVIGGSLWSLILSHRLAK